MQTHKVQKDPHFRPFIWEMIISHKILFCQRNGFVNIQITEYILKGLASNIIYTYNSQKHVFLGETY